MRVTFSTTKKVKIRRTWNCRDTYKITMQSHRSYWWTTMQRHRSYWWTTMQRHRSFWWMTMHSTSLLFKTCLRANFRKLSKVSVASKPLRLSKAGWTATKDSSSSFYWTTACLRRMVLKLQWRSASCVMQKAWPCLTFAVQHPTKKLLSKEMLSRQAWTTS